MNSVLYAVGILAFLIVIFWFIQNEKAGDKSGSIGFLATKRDDDAPGQ